MSPVIVVLAVVLIVVIMLAYMGIRRRSPKDGTPKA
jgi:hypothetical protein